MNYFLILEIDILKVLAPSKTSPLAGFSTLLLTLILFIVPIIANFVTILKKLPLLFFTLVF